MQPLLLFLLVISLLTSAYLISSSATSGHAPALRSPMTYVLACVLAGAVMFANLQSMGQVVGVGLASLISLLIGVWSRIRNGYQPQKSLSEVLGDDRRLRERSKRDQTDTTSDE